MNGAERCYLSCTECGRPCNGTAFGRQTHRFDCCGVIVAHVPAKVRGGDDVWVRRLREAGYLTGLSQTTPRTKS